MEVFSYIGFRSFLRIDLEFSFLNKVLENCTSLQLVRDTCGTTARYISACYFLVWSKGTSFSFPCMAKPDSQLGLFNRGLVLSHFLALLIIVSTSSLTQMLICNTATLAFNVYNGLLQCIVFFAHLFGCSALQLFLLHKTISILCCYLRSLSLSSRRLRWRLSTLNYLQDMRC